MNVSNVSSSGAHMVTYENKIIAMTCKDTINPEILKYRHDKKQQKLLILEQHTSIQNQLNI